MHPFLSVPHETKRLNTHKPDTKQNAQSNQYASRADNAFAYVSYGVMAPNERLICALRISNP